MRTSPPSAPPHPQRLHRQHTTCGRLYRKHLAKNAGVPPEKQDFQKQQNQAECLVIKCIYAYLLIKFASALGVRVRLSFAGWGLARAPHAAVSSESKTNFRGITGYTKKRTIWETEGRKLTKSSPTTPSLTDRKKGYPKHKCCRKNNIYIFEKECRH